ncbi:competence lipoprotein ComL [Pseudomonas syringae pv. actinidiae ICMP 18804]|nr:competence lipoprotein ComL [Pseudomonas syringae pv. actinidiae ICMP 18804]
MGLIDGSAPLPPGQTRADQDIKKQYQDAKDSIPKELLPENQAELDKQAEKDAEAKGTKSRSWFSYMTLGLFD